MAGGRLARCCWKGKKAVLIELHVKTEVEPVRKCLATTQPKEGRRTISVRGIFVRMRGGSLYWE